jgi:hypothetical protein
MPTIAIRTVLNVYRLFSMTSRPESARPFTPGRITRLIQPSPAIVLDTLLACLVKGAPALRRMPSPHVPSAHFSDIAASVHDHQ